MMLAFVLTFAASAQQHVTQAFARLNRSGDTRQVRVFQENDNDGRLTALLEIYRFSSRSLLDDVLTAFDQDQGAAYYMLSERAGDAGRHTTALTYGTEGESVLVGNDSQSNYRVICFLDRDNEQFRHGYVVEWTELDDGSLDGRLISTYGKRPTSAGKTYKRARVFTSDDLHSLDSLGLYDDVTGALRELAPTLKGMIGDIADGSAEVLDELRNHGIDLEGALDSETLQGLGNIVVGTAQDPDGEFTDDVSWLTAFNHYRNAFLRASKRQSSSAAAYATNVLKLCKQAGKVGLSDNEKRLCVKSIKEMRKATRDSFVQGLLDEAATLLR